MTVPFKIVYLDVATMIDRLISTMHDKNWNKYIDSTLKRQKRETTIISCKVA